MAWVQFGRIFEDMGEEEEDATILREQRMRYIAFNQRLIDCEDHATTHAYVRQPGMFIIHYAPQRVRS